MPGPYTQEQYECALCHEPFIQADDWSNEQALEHLKDLGGPADESKSNLVCADCYRKIAPARN